MHFRILILIISFTFQINHSFRYKLYFCNTTEKLEELRSFKDNFERFIQFNGTIYFIFEHRIVFTRSFKLANSIKLDDLLRFSHFNFYEEANDENILPTIMPKETRVLGHIYDAKQMKIKELYFIDFNQTINLINEFAYELIFQKQLAQRHLLVNLSNSDRLSFYLNLDSEQFDGTHKSKTKYFNAIEFEDKQIILKFDYWSSLDGQLANNTILVRFNEKSETSNQIYSLRLANMSHKTIKFFIIYPFRSLKDLYFVGIDESVFLIEIAKFKFRYNSSESKRLKVMEMFQSSIDFEELFSCNVPIKYENELKGIYVKDQKFFIFIKRFYLKIENDLFAKKYFALNEKVYENAIALDRLQQDVEYEIKFSVWIKMKYKDNVTFSLSQANVYSIDYQDERLIFRKDEFENYLQNCEKNTLILSDQSVYCFHEDYYFYLYKLENENKKSAEEPYEKIEEDKKLANEDLDETYFYRRWLRRKSIVSIFENTAVSWSKNQNLKLIIHYDNAKFIFMTQTHLFIFDYQSFAPRSDKSIVVNYVSSDQFQVFENCLFQNCTYINRNIINRFIHLIFSSYYKYYIFISLSFLSLITIYSIAKRTRIRLDSKDSKSSKDSKTQSTASIKFETKKQIKRAEIKSNDQFSLPKLNTKSSTLTYYVVK